MSLLDLFRLRAPTKRFPELDGDIPNPERGWYVGYNLARAGDASRIRAAGRTLAIALVQLDDYRSSMALAGAFLAQLEQGFTRVREGGIKVILRFRYNSDADKPDAPKAIILSHIRELAPLLRRNADVIALIQMGMVGAWGEGHSSTNGLDNDDARSEILHAQLAWPGFVCVRTPGMKRAYLERHGPADGGRIGFYDDCYLASASDRGTYRDPADHAFFDGENTPVGGETCALYPPRTDGPTALVEMAKDRVSYLNAEYRQSVLSVWAATGHHAEITRRLGYRFVLTAAKITHGSVSLRLVNRGFAAPFAARRAYLVLRREGYVGGAARVEVPLRADASQWKPGDVAIDEKFTASFAPGTWRVGLWLPDAAGSLRADPRYAIRLANDGWDSATGENALATLRVTGVG